MALNKTPDKRIEAQVDRLASALDKARLAEYVDLQTNTRRLLLVNFWVGVVRGFGTAVGFTLVGTAVLYVLRQLVSIPVLGAFIAQLVNIVTLQLGRH
ncbi:MAG TPA: DUF5665 domain-containing protein [bacterium]|nr:DUF5665 domain-containing protein [bacterium]